MLFRSAATPITPKHTAPTKDSSTESVPSPATALLPDTSPTEANPLTPRSGRFAINVGTFRSEEIATAERARLASITGLQSRTVKLEEAGATLYRVTLGSFANHDEAASTADQLVRHGLAAEALVVPLTETTPTRP